MDYTLIDYALIDIVFFSVAVTLYLSVTIAAIMTGIRSLTKL